MDNNPENVAQEMEHDPSRDAVQSALRFLRILQYRKTYVFAAVGIAAFLGAIYFFTATRIYEASASLLITQTGSEVWETSMKADGSRQALIPTYEKLFSSAVVLEGVIQQLAALPEPMRIDFRNIPRDNWITKLRENLTARGLRQTNIIEIRYRSQSPTAGTAVVEAIVKSYLDFMEKNHKDVSIEIVKMLDTERVEIENQLATKQTQLLELQHRVADLGLSSHSTVVHPALQRVISINQALIDARKERVSLSATLIAIRDAIRNGGDLRQHLVTVEPIVGRELMLNALGLNPQATEVIASLERKLLEDRAKLDTLLAHFGPVHPRVTEITRTIQNTEQYVADFQGKVNQRLAGIRQDDLAPMLTAMVEEKLAQLWAHEKELTEQYERSETEAVQLNDRRAELTLVELDVQRLRKLYDSLLERMSNIDIKQNSSDVRVAVVSEPTATKWPVSPRLKIVIGLCLMAGLGGGAVVVYIIDVLDDRFRSPEELSEQIGTPVLAVVRKLAESDATGAEALQVHVAAEAVESEAFRTLRTTLAFSGQDLQRLAITSAEPGDGKTTIISNLGVSYAQAGRKTLLIDADMRRPGLTKLFDMRKLGGLSEVLRSEEEIAQFCQDHVQTTGVPGLFLLPCGSKRSDPGELLSHPRLEDLIAWAESTYDQVLIDCPPILAASDAAIVGRLTDGVVLVVQPQKNHRRLVIRAAEELNSLRVKLVGIVANKVGEDKEGYYGYGHGYGYGYGYGYGNGYGNGGEDEADEELASQHDESRERERPSAPASTATDDPAAEPAEIDENSSAVPLPDIVQMPSAGSGGPRRVIAPRRAA